MSVTHKIRETKFDTNVIEWAAELDSNGWPDLVAYHSGERIPVVGLTGTGMLYRYFDVSLPGVKTDPDNHRIEIDE